MIDYTKVNNLPVSVERILEHEQLTFPMSNVATTGELLNRAQVAHYGNMEFVVKNGYVKIKGSYHKHAQGGENFMDFTFRDIQDEIEKLAYTFQFDPKEAHYNFIEIGVNIEVSHEPTSLIKNFLLYRNKEFENLPVQGKGFGRQCVLQQIIIKVYNKSLSCELPYHLLRFEVKVKRMEFLKQYGIDGLTMDDLNSPDVYHKLKKMLLDVFDRIILFNPDTDMDSIQNQKDRELVLQGRYPEYWKELPRQRKSEQIKRFTELTGTNNLKKELAQLISDKWNKLLNPDKLTTFQAVSQNSIADKLTTFNRVQIIQPNEVSGQINTTINGYYRECPVTRISIEMQKVGSRLLSNTGLKWLRDNDPLTYDLLKRRFLPRRGYSGIHTQFEKNEISHISKQIRNEYYGRRRKKVTTYADQCFSLQLK